MLKSNTEKSASEIVMWTEPGPSEEAGTAGVGAEGGGGIKSNVPTKGSRKARWFLQRGFDVQKDFMSF